MSVIFVSHHFKMWFKNVFISQLAAKVNLFAYIEYVVPMTDLRFWFLISLYSISLLEVTLRIWVWTMVIFVIGWSCPTKLRDWWSHNWDHSRVTWMNCWLFNICYTMLAKEFSAVLPLYSTSRYYKISNFTVKFNWGVWFGKSYQSCKDFCKNKFNGIVICEADWGNRRNCKRLNTVIKQFIYFSSLKFIESSYCFLWTLVKCNLPVWSCQEIFIHHYEHWMNTWPIQLLWKPYAFVIRVSKYFTLFEDWSENCKIFDLDSFSLDLDLVCETFCNATPYHVEKSHCLSLSGF